MLIVYHGYRPLVQMHQEAGVPLPVAQQAWAALNDIHRSDAPLMYAPHILALGCILYAWAARSPPLPPQPLTLTSTHAPGHQQPAPQPLPAGSPFVPASAGGGGGGGSVGAGAAAEAWDCVAWLHTLDVSLQDVRERSHDPWLECLVGRPHFWPQHAAACVHGGRCRRWPR